MKGFIEVTVAERAEKITVLLSVAWIFKVIQHKNYCRISLCPSGYNDYAHQYVDASETYEEVKELIRQAE